MPGNVASTSRLQASRTDFLCNRENVLWLLGHSAFYRHCPSFDQLWPQVQRLSQYMRNHGFVRDRASEGCGKCDMFKVMAWQNMLADGFAQIFLWLYDTGRMQELQTLKAFASAAKRATFRRVVLAYSGKATGKKERLVIVE